MKKIAIIILNYQNYEDTLECIESLQQNICENVDIIVVDNNSTNNSVGELEKKLGKKYKLIVTDKNLGYAGGNNVGIKYAYEKQYEYICILNNDTIIKNNFISKLEEYMTCHPKCAIVGPAILEFDDSNKIQSTGGYINYWKACSGLLNSGNFYETFDKTPQEVEWVGGACMMFRRELIEKVGMIPECYFLFYEETDWCCQARRKGLQVVCQPEAYIYHKASAAVKKTEGLSFYLMERNRVRFVLRNASMIKKVVSISWLFFSTLFKIILGKPQAEDRLKYYWDGLTNKVSDKYPFIIIQ